ncbi:hypothetical protein AB4Z40_27580 [Bosea sp. 2YAB26]
MCLSQDSIAVAEEGAVMAFGGGAILASALAGALQHEAAPAGRRQEQ